MEFSLDVNSCPYDANLHSHCLSNLKDYGDYYQITVSKMINNLERVPLTEKQKFYVECGLSRSEAIWLDYCISNDRLDIFGRTIPERIVNICGIDFEVFPDKSNRTLENERIGRYMSNILRSKKTLDELGNCNTWDYFVTFTISPEKFDRYDFKAFYKSFGIFKQHLKRDFGFKLNHVFVPEQHKDGAWHLHGLISGLPLEQLTEYNLADFYPFTDVKIPKYIKDKLMKGEKLYYWKAYNDKFGWCVIEKLKSSAKASNYITKYIGKGFMADENFANMRLVLPSLGLKRAEKLKKGFTSVRDVKPSFDCDYCTTFKFPKSKYSLTDVESYFLSQ